jgi:hypothetical protein
LQDAQRLARPISTTPPYSELSKEVCQDHPTIAKAILTERTRRCLKHPRDLGSSRRISSFRFSRRRGSQGTSTNTHPGKTAKAAQVLNQPRPSGEKQPLEANPGR